jgi:hypothetical protein
MYGKIKKNKNLKNDNDKNLKIYFDCKLLYNRFFFQNR